MRHRFLRASAVLLLVLGLAACNEDDGPVPTGAIEYQPPFAPISIAIDTNGTITVTADAHLVTPVGEIHFVGGVAQGLKDVSGDNTLVIIRQTINDQQVGKAYQINSGRKMRIDMNGRFITEIRRNQITIDAAPGSTIKITDVGPSLSPSQQVHAAARIDKEDWDVDENSKATYLDFEKKTGGHTADVGYDHMTGELKLLNGAQISQLKIYNWASFFDKKVPTEAECANTHIKEWRDSFTTKELHSYAFVACIKTAESDYGNFTIIPDTSKKPVGYNIATWTWTR